MFLFGGLLLGGGSTFAAAPVFSFHQVAPSDYFYADTFDNLVLDFSVAPTASDVLSALVVKNEGLAASGKEISKLVFWQDDGDNRFEGFGRDTKVAEGIYDDNNYVWVFNNVNVLVAQDTRFFVSVETRRGGTNGKSFQFSVPAYFDSNNNGLYEPGDAGLFFLNNKHLPAITYANDQATTYRTASVDSFAPVTVFNNIHDGDTFYGYDFPYLILGQSRDQGGSATAKVELCVNNTCNEVSNLGDNFSYWSYNWTGVEGQSYQMYVKSEDFNGNQFVGTPIAIKVDQALYVSFSQSSIAFNKTTAAADGVKSVGIDVYVRDQNGDPIKGQLVEIAPQDTTTSVSVLAAYSNAAGLVHFDSGSSTVGTAVYYFYLNGVQFNKNYSVSFTENNAPDRTYLDGRFVKTKNLTAVYFLDKNNVRHAYPTQKVWESYFGKDFSFVETISTATMGSYDLGRNVPFKTGTLMKIPSVNKVYRVENGAIIRWVKTEVVAKNLYGANWAQLVVDLPESFFTDYTEGTVIE
jgi:hypothetical protein